MTTEMKELKKAQRKACTTSRRALSAQELKEKSSAICRALTTLPEVKSAKVVFSYCPTWDEADISEFNEWAKKSGKTVAYPISLPEGVMLAAVPEDESAFATDRYGIAAPIRERSEIVEPADIDLIIVPCVGFDEMGERLGHGAGYYDRYFPACPQASRVMVAFEAQKLPEVITEATDVPMKTTVTEKCVYRPDVPLI